MIDQLKRLDRFREGHPGVIVSLDAFGDGWDAVIPLGGTAERFLHRADLGWLLDDARKILRGGDPRARRR